METQKAGLDVYSGYSSIKYLNKLSVIGTHNSASFGVKGPLKSLVKCQSMTIEEQLEFGVRFFDLSLRAVEGVMEIYSGRKSCHMSYIEFQNKMIKFLNENPNEFVLLRLSVSELSKSTTYWLNTLKRVIDSKVTNFLIKGVYSAKLYQLRGKITILECEAMEKSGYIVHRQNLDVFCSEENYVGVIKQIEGSLKENECVKILRYDGGFSHNWKYWLFGTPKRFAEGFKKYLYSNYVPAEIPIGFGIHVFDFPEMFQTSYCSLITKLLDLNNAKRITG